MSFEEGATIGVGSVAAAAALYDKLAIPWPQNPPSRPYDDAKAPFLGEKPWILIWGASCVTGMMAIQLARRSGLRVFAVAGIQNASELRRLGADRVEDRHDPEAAITAAKVLGIMFAIDCVGSETATNVVKAMSRGGRLACLVKKPDHVLAQKAGVLFTDILIKQFHEKDEFGRRLVDFMSRGLVDREIQPLRYDIVEGGLNALEHGLQRLKHQAVSGRKLVVKFE